MIKIDIRHSQIFLCEEYLNRIRVINLVNDYETETNKKLKVEDSLVRELSNCIPQGDDL